MKITEETKRRFMYTLVVCMLWGVFAHGFMLFNKLSFHDDQAALFYVGGTYSSGRWMLGLLGEAVKAVGGVSNYSLPAYSGMIALFFIALSAFLLFQFFHIENRLTMAGLCGVMICIPTVTGMFGYMFTFPYYTFGLLICVLACHLFKGFFSSDRSFALRFGGVIAGVLLFAMSIGIYQAIICTCTTILVLDLILFVIDEKPFKLSAFFKRVFVYLAALSAAFVCYSLLNRLFIILKNVDVNSKYDFWGDLTPALFLERIRITYVNFFKMGNGTQLYNIFPMTTGVIYRILLAALFLCVLVVVISLIKEKARKNVPVFLILTALLPFTIDMSFMMDSENRIHALEQYSYIFVPFTLVLLIAAIVRFGWLPKKILAPLPACAAVLLLFLSVLFARYSNICYLSSDIYQTQALGYFTTLITRIKSTPGYVQDMPVVYYKQDAKSDSNIPTIKQFSEITTVPYVYAKTGEQYLNDYAWRNFLYNWLGYYPKRLEEDALAGKEEELAAMDVYPNDNSIRIIDGIVVIKFAE